MGRTRKKLIEVALPLDAINKTSARESRSGLGTTNESVLQQARDESWQRACTDNAD
jgi:adenine-specific DNA methylase